MLKETFRRVDETAMLRVLEETRGTVTEVILRLAWQMGFIAEEIRLLKWSDVDLEGGVVRLPDRTVPVTEDAAECLRARRDSFTGKSSEFVAVSDLRRVHMNRVYIFRFAREALERGGLTGISLMDLRHDFIIRALEHHSKAYVARVSGVTLATVENTFIKYVETPYSGRERPTEADRADEGERILRLIFTEGPSAAGLTLWLTWKQKLQLKEIAALTWDDVDLAERVIRLPDRTAAVDGILADWLARLRTARRETDDPHVVLTPKSRRPFDVPRLSRLVRGTLIKGGLSHLTLRDLILQGKREGDDAVLLRRAAERGSVTRNDAMALLNTDKGRAWSRLRRLVEEGKLVRVGERYYLPGTVVPPEKQFEAVRAYLEEAGGAYRGELAKILRLEAKQCGWILRGWVKEGRLRHEKQRYFLPEDQPETVRSV